MEPHEAKELDLLVERLQRTFPLLPPEAIRQEVSRIHHQYDGSRVRDFLAVLIEREARERLGRRELVS